VAVLRECLVYIEEIFTGLVADTMEEDVWAYNNGELWGNEPPQFHDNE
jgi:hypothetical protein